MKKIIERIVAGEIAPGHYDLWIDTNGESPQLKVNLGESRGGWQTISGGSGGGGCDCDMSDYVKKSELFPTITIDFEHPYNIDNHSVWYGNYEGNQDEILRINLVVENPGEGVPSSEYLKYRENDGVYASSSFYMYFGGTDSGVPEGSNYLIGYNDAI